MNTEQKPITLGILESIEATSDGRVPQRRRDHSLAVVGWAIIIGVAAVILAGTH